MLIVRIIYSDLLTGENVSSIKFFQTYFLNNKIGFNVGISMSQELLLKEKILNYDRAEYNLLFKEEPFRVILQEDNYYRVRFEDGYSVILPPD